MRTGLALSPSGHRATLVRWSLLGWGVGLPANVVAAWAFEHWPYLPPSIGALLGVAMQGVGIPMLALGYAAAVGLVVVNGRRFVTVFAPVGRMALTNYLMHSILCVALSFGFGLALWWRVGASMAIAAAVVVLQIPLSAWWLSRFRFGPSSGSGAGSPTAGRSEMRFGRASTLLSKSSRSGRHELTIGSVSNCSP